MLALSLTAIVRADEPEDRQATIMESLRIQAERRDKRALELAVIVAGDGDREGKIEAVEKLQQLLSPNREVIDHLITALESNKHIGPSLALPLEITTTLLRTERLHRGAISGGPRFVERIRAARVRRFSGMDKIPMAREITNLLLAIDQFTPEDFEFVLQTLKNQMNPFNRTVDGLTIGVQLLDESRKWATANGQASRLLAALTPADCFSLATHHLLTPNDVQLAIDMIERCTRTYDSDWLSTKTVREGFNSVMERARSSPEIRDHINALLVPEERRLEDTTLEKKVRRLLSDYGISTIEGQSIILRTLQQRMQQGTFNPLQYIHSQTGTPLELLSDWSYTLPDREGLNGIESIIAEIPAFLEKRKFKAEKISEIIHVLREHTNETPEHPADYLLRMLPIAKNPEAAALAKKRVFEALEITVPDGTSHNIEILRKLARGEPFGNITADIATNVEVLGVGARVGAPCADPYRDIGSRSNVIPFRGRNIR